MGGGIYRRREGDGRSSLGTSSSRWRRRTFEFDGQGFLVVVEIRRNGEFIYYVHFLFGHNSASDEFIILGHQDPSTILLASLLLLLPILLVLQPTESSSSSISSLKSYNSHLSYIDNNDTAAAAAAASSCRRSSVVSSSLAILYLDRLRSSPPPPSSNANLFFPTQ